MGHRPKEVATAIGLVQKARELLPANRDIQFLLAELLTLSGKWHEASLLVDQLAANDGEISSTTRFFGAIVEANHIAEALAIMERTGADQRWRPLYEALRAAQVGSPDYLNRVAPEIRIVAQEILHEIASNLFPEVSVPVAK